MSGRSSKFVNYQLPLAVNVRAPGKPQYAGLHLREATYYRRSIIEPYKDAYRGFAACGHWWSMTEGDSCVASTGRSYVEQVTVGRLCCLSVLDSICVACSGGTRIER